MMPNSQPVSAYLALLIAGFLPVIFVGLFFDDLPNRLVVQWNDLGHITVIGTRANSVMIIALVAAAISVAAVLVGAVQNESFAALGIREPFLALNFAQVVTIGLTCAALVTEALGFGVWLRDTVPSAAAALLATCALLCWRIARSPDQARLLRAVLMLGTIGFAAAALIVSGLTLAFAASPLGIGALAAALIFVALLLVPARA